MSKTVALFVGHGTSTNGGWDSGCTYGKYTEAGLMKGIAKYAINYLKKSGVKVITDYPANNINMVKQVAKSNAAGVSLHVALHCDYSKAPSGTIPLYTSAKGKKAAKLMNQYVMKYVGIKTRGVGRRTDLYELNATNAPAVIFECGSIKADLAKMKSKQKAYGKGIAEGICKYLGVPFKGDSSKKKKEVYRVRKSWDNEKSQKGAFRSLANAKACADKNGCTVFNSAGKSVYKGK